MTNPYREQGARAFWRSAVADRSLFDIDEVWNPKFQILRNVPVVTFGSCFAQHIGRALAARGFAWTSYELAPRDLSAANARRFNYGIFSARTANIYTTTLLLQWVRWAIGKEVPPDLVWEQEGRWFDPFRPAIEPGGFASREEALAARGVTIAAFRRCIKEARLFVFTLGLTESWHDDALGIEYPACPGTIAGTFDKERHRFENQAYPRVMAGLEAAFDRMKIVNPELRFLLTVSPVPLTATKTEDHVMVATSYSKSTLRAVAGDLANQRQDTDYFPSYELISAPPIRATFFEPNMREVNGRGVAYVMDRFFGDMERRFGDIRLPAEEKEISAADRAEALVCEEELLDAFGPTP